MKSLIWKEWRENIKWMAVPAVLILLPMALLGGPGEPVFGAGGVILVLIIAAFGAALGFVQVFFESRGDHRAILLHRPLSRSQIFLSKVIAGVGVYLLAAGIPFVGLELWMATPGNMAAPWQWRTALPWLADILAGLVYYFAGMLAAQREARWYGSRCLALAAALGCTIFVWTVSEFWQALLVIAFAGTLMATAAWGSFLAGGAYAPQPRISKPALAIVFLAGLSVVSLLAKSFIGAAAFDSGLSYGHTLDRQGRVLTVPWKSGVGPVGKVTDLHGNVPPDLEGRRVDRNLLEEIEAPMTGIDWPVHQSYRNPGRFYVQYLNATTPGSEVWYYSPEQGRLLGYDDNFHQFLGSFGPDGFVPAGEESRARFDGELHYLTRLWDAFPPEFLVFPGGVYAVDFSRRTIRALFAPSAGEMVRGASRWKDRRENRSLAVVSTSTSIHLLTANGEPVISLRRSFEPDTYGNVSVGRLDSPERYVVWYAPSRWLDPDVRSGMPDYLLEYDSAGREIARQTVPPRPEAASSPAQALFGLATPLTEAAVLVGSVRQIREQSRLSGGMQAWVLCDFLEMWISSFLPRPAYSMDTSSGLFLGFAALSLLSSATCALVCLLLARRYSFSRARCVGWALCGFLFGLVGLLAMLALQEWPARIACPACRKPRRVDRDRCEHCGAAHDPPATDGTEIFETTIPNSATVRDLGLTGMLQ